MNVSNVSYVSTSFSERRGQNLEKLGVDVHSYTPMIFGKEIVSLSLLIKTHCPGFSFYVYSVNLKKT